MEFSISVLHTRSVDIERNTDTAINELTALVALIRRVCGLDDKLSTYEATVRKNFQNWIMNHHAGAGDKFNEEQMQWLQMIRDHIISFLF